MFTQIYTPRRMGLQWKTQLLFCNELCSSCFYSFSDYSKALKYLKNYSIEFYKIFRTNALWRALCCGNCLGDKVTSGLCYLTLCILGGGAFYPDISNVSNHDRKIKFSWICRWKSKEVPPCFKRWKIPKN